MHQSLIHDRETEQMTVGSLRIACQTADTYQRTGLCPHIAMRKTVFHSRLERPIFTSYRQRGEKMQVDVRVSVSIAQQSHLDSWRQIVVQRQSAAISYTKTFGGRCSFGNGMLYDVPGMTYRGIRRSGKGSDTIEKSFCKKEKR